MNNFDYYNPVRVIFGEGVIDDAGAAIAEYGKKAMIVSYTDVSFYGDLFDKIHRALDAADISYFDYFAVEANPTIAHAKAGMEKCTLVV